MIAYVEDFILKIEGKLADPEFDEETRQTNTIALEQMKVNLDKLKPVVEASDRNLKEFEERDFLIQDMVHKFRKHLMIEKIRMEE